MFVKQWMVKNPVTIRVDDSLDSAYYLMKEKGVNRLLVVDDKGKMVGILTKGDCLRISPSPASMLSRQEANYLLSKLMIREVMTKQLITANPDDLIEEVALILREKGIEGLPVLENGDLVGIITKSDIFDAFMDIMGVGAKGTRVILEADNHCGILADVAACFKNQEVLIDSVAKIHRNEHNKVYLLIRFSAEENQQKALMVELDTHGYTIESVSY
jgi:acetoin utilization protein AcuB